MKRRLQLITILTLLIKISFGQTFDTINFEQVLPLQNLTIDTISNLNNIWQIGVPNKAIFNNAHSTPNVIITDTINPYPINDTSIFTIRHIVDEGFYYKQMAYLKGWYYVNSDSLNDYGLIEFSPDNGLTWIDIINDSAYIGTHIYWYTPIPKLTGNSNGWKYFDVNLAPLGYIFNFNFGDTVLYRFTFFSDNIQTNKAGLMFDDLIIEDYVQEGISESKDENLISIYPNPSNEMLFIRDTEINCKSNVQIINAEGQIVFEVFDFKGESINTSLLPNGLYMLKYSNDRTCHYKKFVVEH